MAEVTAPNLTQDTIQRLVESLDYVHCRLLDIDGDRAHIECTIVAVSQEGAASYLHRRANQTLRHLAVRNGVVAVQQEMPLRPDRGASA